MAKSVLLAVAIGSFAWMPSYYARRFGKSPGEVGNVLSLLVGGVSGHCPLPMLLFLSPHPL